MPASSTGRFSAALAAASLLFGAKAVLAAGFAIYEQGTSGLGNAFAGAAAVAEDATTIFWNPAGMTRLPGQNIAVSGAVIVPQSEFTDGGSFLAAPIFPISDVGPSDAGTPAFVGSTYYSTQMSDDVWFGIGLNAPFGLVTDYPDGWAGRYHALHSELLTINANPSLAFKVSESFSIGVGVNLQYAYASLSNAIDTGAVLGGPAATGTADSRILVDGSSFAFGANAGVLWEPIEGTRIGAAYRMELEHEIGGTSVLNVNPAVPVIGGGTFTGSADADITLPDSVAISVYQQITPELAFVGDATWTNWSDLQALVVTVGPTLPIGAGANVTPLMWNDTWRFSGGLIYKYGTDWTFRVGYAYDESPVPSATFRTPRIPDNDRHWVTAGVGFRLDEHLSVDLSYAHLFVGDTAIANTLATGHTLIGTYDSSVDIFSFQLNTSFAALEELF